jgi:uncharacterized membrane protein
MIDLIVKHFYDNKIQADTFYKILSIASFVVLTLDFLWIKFVMQNEYNRMIPEIQQTSMTIRFIPTILSYMTIILPIVLFVIPKISPKTKMMDSLLFGGLMGLLMYGMFSFTNYALIEKWSFKVVLLDTLWGAFLYAMATLATSYFLF